MTGDLKQSWAGTVIICAAHHWEGVRLHDRQLAENLASHVPVLYVDPPFSVLTRWRRPELRQALSGPRFRVLGPNLARLTPLVLPAMQRPGMSRITQFLKARLVRNAVLRLGGTVRALVETSTFAPIMGRCGEELQVYWAQDDFVGSADLLGLSAERIRRGEQDLLSRAHLVIAANPDVARAVSRPGRRTVLVPYGCDFEHFASAREMVPPLELVSLPRPVIGFMGHLGDRIEMPLLEAVADTGQSLLLIGPRHPRFARAAMDPLMARPNVHWVGRQDFEDLPKYLSVVDVGLVPYVDSAFNRGSFPLKTLEYLAAGIPVVATDLPAIRWLNCPDIRVAKGGKAYAEAVLEVLARSDADGIQRRQRFAAAHSWKVRAEAFAEALGVHLGQTQGAQKARRV
ncbi:MAG TPA: hypothetical protein DEP35_21420 [Deltaproteobacteria bacterium]|nr:hypothetical protein [Deltaproteobacteria bacterium]